jgi:signal recognition particle subunit SRP54
VGKALTPTQQLIKAVNEELTAILGGETADLNLHGSPPHIIMLVGLQGSGKTTSAAKIANYVLGKKHKPYLVPADVYRPAAIEQLSTLAAQLDIPCYPADTAMNPVDIARKAAPAAALAGCDVVLLDTAGRLHIDEELMRELTAIKEIVRPAEILLVADAMTGQEAVSVAEAFDQALDISGVVLTKMDGDARGGAALSIKSVTGKSIKFVGMGEKISELELFHPGRIAGRILGMGDMLTLIEKTQDSIAGEEAEELARKLQKAEFDLEDFRINMRRLKKLGSLDSLLKMIPGLGGLRQKIGAGAMPEKEMLRAEAIINSMTGEERQRPKIINSSRKNRIAKGSGNTVGQVNQLLKQFEGMRAMMAGMLDPNKSRGAGKLRGAYANMPFDPGRTGGINGAANMNLGAGSGGLSKTALKKKKKMRKEQRKKKR